MGGQYTRFFPIQNPFLALFDEQGGTHPVSYARTVNAAVGGGPSGSTVCFTYMLSPKVLNAN